MKNSIEVSVKDIDVVQKALLLLKAISNYSQISKAEFDLKYPDYKTGDRSLLWMAFSIDATKILEEKMNPDEKIKEAKRLMLEAYNEKVKNLKIERGEDLCQCGHKRSDHTETYSFEKSIVMPPAACRALESKFNYFQNKFGKMESFDNKGFGILINGIRAIRGVSLRIASTQAGVSAATMSRVENGKAPDLDTFIALCEWAGVLDCEIAIFSK